MNRAAIRYAKATLSLAQEQELEAKVNEDMKSIANAISESSELAQMLSNPVVKSSDKKEVLSKIFKGITVNTNSVIDALISNKRLTLLPEVAASYNNLFDQLRDSQVATVTTAAPLSKELEAKVLSKVKELTGKEAEVENIIDESIIGGFILRVGDIQYNASIANKLDKLKREFILN